MIELLYPIAIILTIILHIVQLAFVINAWEEHLGLAVFYGLIHGSLGLAWWIIGPILLEKLIQWLKAAGAG